MQYVGIGKTGNGLSIAVGTPLSNLVWHYEGGYQIFDVERNATQKTLTLDYDCVGNDYFGLYVIDESTIELYHVRSGTGYAFAGSGYI